jgi:GNAT superfamily N-acetyltransferase
MQPAHGIQIESLSESGCDEYFLYLNDHRSDNGTEDTGYFMPLSKSDSRFPSDKEQFFRAGLGVSVDSSGWRRAWVARAANQHIVGHVDLRPHPVAFAGHRCLLGMGVDRHHRRLGLGAWLLAHATDWAVAHTRLEWLDLQTISANDPAMRLFLRVGFTRVAEVVDIFKLDRRYLSATTMTKRLRHD